jgi:quinol monooxygenase YgiN
VRIGRREFLAGAGAVMTGSRLLAASRAQGSGEMYGLIGKMMTVPGQRDAFVDILLQGTGSMPGCLSYIVAKDPADDNALWVTEVWDSKASHEASLSLPSVKEAIGKGRAMIAGFGDRVVTTPVGGVGLTRSP